MEVTSEIVKVVPASDIGDYQGRARKEIYYVLCVLHVQYCPIYHLYYVQIWTIKTKKWINIWEISAYYHSVFSEIYVKGNISQLVIHCYSFEHSMLQM